MVGAYIDDKVSLSYSKRMIKIRFNAVRPGRFHIFFWLTMLVLLAAARVAAEERLAHCMEGRKEYLETLLKMVLSYSDKRYVIEERGDICSQTRQIEDVISGRLSFMWGGTTQELEERLHPIRYPLFKGLLGHRLLIIRQGDQPLFDQVETLEDLGQIKLGQGRMWSDTEILEAAGMRVVKTNAYRNLFPMLEGGRFDAFPRGASEPWMEIVQWADLKLTVEQKLVLIYPMPAYFFVSKGNIELARDFERGFEEAVKDGSFDRVFFADSEVQKVLNQANLKDRKVFRIKNPFLTPETPLDRQELWLDVSNLPDQ